MTVDHEMPFTNAEALRFGWNTTRANLKPLVIMGAVGAFLAMLNQALTRHGDALLGLVIQILQAAVALAFLRAALALHDGKPLDLSNFRALLENFFTYLLTGILYVMIFVGGLVLLIVPGVIWGLRFSMAGYLVADGRTDPIAALHESGRLTEGVKGRLLELGLLMLGINLLGALALGIGLLFTVPTTLIAGAFVFRRLQVREVQRHAGSTSASAVPVAGTP